MYKIAGEQLPAVIHVSARAIASHALSIFGDHRRVRLPPDRLCNAASGGVQEVMDLGAVAHLAAIKGRVPFLHFFDGFRTSHEIQKIEMWDYEDLKEMLDMDAVNAYRKSCLNSERPTCAAPLRTGHLLPGQRSLQPAYDAVPAIVEEYMARSTPNKAPTTACSTTTAPPMPSMSSSPWACATPLRETVDHMNSRWRQSWSGGRYACTVPSALST